MGPEAVVSTADDAALADSCERSIVWWRVYNSILKTEKAAVEEHLASLNRVRARARARVRVCVCECGCMCAGASAYACAREFV